MNEREVRVEVPLLFGGVSQQPASVRFQNQVQDASNIDFAIDRGPIKRPPTKYIATLTGFTAGRDIRVHAVERDEDERYLMFYGDGAVRVVTELGVFPPQVLEATVTTSADALSYLTANGADGEDIRMVTVADYTIVLNTTVSVGLVTSDSYTVTANWDTYEIMTSQVPAEGSYHRTLNDSTGDRKGYYVYSAGTQTFGVRRMRTNTTSAWKSSTGSWDESANNPMGFRVGFQRLEMSLTNCTTVLSSGSTYTLTKTGAFTSYTRVAGDMIYITGGTGVTAGWATIDSRDSNDQLTVTATGTCVLAAAANISTDGIGAEYQVSADFDKSIGNAVADMNEVAARLQAALQAVGCADGLIAWNNVGTDGYFTITSPYKGTDSVVKSVSAPDSDLFDLTASTSPNRPFNFADSTSTAGTGGNPTTTKSVGSRWTRTAAPDQPQARPDPTKMPVKLVRTSPCVYPARSLTGASAAADSIYTSGVAHGLVVGQKVTVTGATGGSPGTINAERTVTEVVSSTQFKTGLDLSGGAATGGTFTARALFSCDTIDWNTRLSGDEISNPAPQMFINAQKIRDVLFGQDRLCLASGQYLVNSQSGDLFNFFNEVATNVTDSDPVVVVLTANKVTTADFVIPYRTSLLVFTFSGQHFDVSWDGAFTPTTVRSTQANDQQCLSTRPIAIDGRIYYLSERGSYAQVNEYYYDDNVVQNVAANVSIQCPTFVPVGIREMCTVRSEGLLLLLPDNDNSLYVYRWYWTGNQKDQSAWTRYDFDASYRISGFAAIRNAVYMLVESASQYILEGIFYEVTGDTF